MLNRRMKLIALVLVLVLLLSIISFAQTTDATAIHYDYFRVRLGLFERLVCMALLPVEGSFVTLKIVRELQMELAPTEEEIKLAGIKDDLLTGGVVAEDWTAVEDKEIVFGDMAKALIVSALKELDEANPPKLRMEHFSLYEKFVLEKEEVREGD